MMDQGKILYQGRPAAADTALYTVPERAAASYTLNSETVETEPSSVVQNVQTMVTQILVAETAALGDTLFIHLVDNSSDAAAVGNRVFRVNLVANSTEWFKLNWLLDAGTTIRTTFTSGSRATVTILGVEVK